MTNEPSGWIGFPRRFWGGALLLVAITGLIYAQTGGFGFSDFDDPHYIVENPRVTGGLTLPNVLWGLTTGYHDSWHPLTWWSHMLDCECFGLAAGAHHLVNVAWHAANAVLLFGLFAFMTGKWGRSLLVAALFAAHPMHVESVAWVSERKDVLCTFFFLLALLGYAKAVTGGKFQVTGTDTPAAGIKAAPSSIPVAPKQREGGFHSPSSSFNRFSLLCFALSLMAKPMAVTLPFVLLLLDFWPLQRVSSFKFSVSSHVPSPHHSITPPCRLLREKWPFFLLTILSSWVTCVSMKRSLNFTVADSIPLKLRLMNVPVAYARYLFKLFWPVNLAPFYPMPKQWEPWLVAACVLVLVILTTLAVCSWKRRPWWLFGWLFFAGTLVPVMGIVPNGYQSLADRYTYIPAIGIFVAVVWGLAEVIRTRAGRMAASALAVIAVGVLGGMAWRQTQTWRNPLTLWTHCLQVTPQNGIAEHNLGFYFWGLGETNQALKHYAAAARLRPEAYEVNMNYGVALTETGRDAEATNCFHRALAVIPQSAMAHYDLALALFNLGDFAGAAEHSRKAAELEPDNCRGWFGLGRALAGMNRHREAVENFQRALDLDPKEPEIYLRLGRELIALGRYDEAMANLNQAAAFGPRWWEAWLELATVYTQRHDEPQAVNCYRRALEANPSCLPALNNLAWLLATSTNKDLRDGNEAVRLSQQACQLTAYREPVFVGTLAAAYAEAGRFDEAVQTATLACDLARSTGQTNALAKNQSLLAEYKNHLPHRE